MRIEKRLAPASITTELHEPRPQRIHKRLGQEVMPLVDRPREENPFPHGMVPTRPAVINNEQTGQPLHDGSLLGDAETQ